MEMFWFITKRCNQTRKFSKYFDSKYYEQTGSIGEVDFIEGVTDESGEDEQGRQWDGRSGRMRPKSSSKKKVGNWNEDRRALPQ